MTIAVMAEVQCVDGSVLSVVPVPKVDRGGVAYEVTLRLLLEGAPFGDVGECSRWQLAQAADSLRAAQAQDGPDAFPLTGADALLDAAGADGHGAAGWTRAQLRLLLPRDRELLCLRSRDPDDGDGTGELRVWVRQDRTWLRASDDLRGRWSTRSRAVLDAWGGSGRGVRALLDGPALLSLLERLVEDAERVVGSPAGTEDGGGARVSAATAADPSP